MNIALIGCGGVGAKRARALPDRMRLVVACDIAIERAEAIVAATSQAPGHAAVERDWQSAVARPDVDAVLVATTNDLLAPITHAAVLAGKHVLLEKPGACTADQLRPIAAQAERRGLVVRVGFNHRHHPALLKAKAMCDAGAVGPIMHLRARYGHGGRPGYDREWRADPAIGGGGELLDQGSHLIDLSRWFLDAPFSSVQGCVTTGFWNMPVEDNCFLLLRTPAGQVAHLHASWTEWKNLFSFEIFGRFGKLDVDGLGGSYGVERLTHYQMTEQMGPPDSMTWEWRGPDLSWSSELAEFAADVALGRRPASDLHNAVAVLEVIDAIYAQARQPVGPGPG